MQRTAALSALRREMAAGEYRIICTYPEALAERVTDPDSMRRETVRVKVGDRLAIGELEELLADSGFTKVDFVYEPGQYSLRGGIFDVFSFSESKPYRLDFFGEEVDSIRRFEISSQLSADRLNEVEIVPNLNGFAGDRISLLAFAGEATYWFFDPDYVLRRVNDLRRKVLGEMEEPAEIDTHLVSRKVLLQDMAGMRLFELRDSLKERPADATVAFRMAPQPKFNKNFELLADDIISNGQRGYKTYILSENRAQLERLENIFYQSGRKEAQINPLPITLHEGFVDHDLKLCFYTDHQIFDRYQRYRINGEIKRDEQMTVAELNQLRMGDYVVHIDHGVGRFGGLVKINENGKVHEAIKLIYKDNDVLFVHVHALHRISRYKSGEGEAPKIYKLGSGALAEAQDRDQEGRQGHLARTDRPLCQAQSQQGICLFAGYLFAAGAGSFVHVGGYARSADRDAGRQAGHGVQSADGSFDLRRCGLRQDRSGDPSGVQGRDRRQAGGRAGAYDDSGPATLPLLRTSAPGFSREGRISQPDQVFERDVPHPI